MSLIYRKPNEIYVKNNDVNKALRILKKKMLNEGIIERG